MIDKIRSIMDKWLTNIAAILFLVAVLATFVGVLDRTFGLNLKTVWAEELTRFSMIWGTLLLIGIGMRRGTQTRLTLLSERLSAKGRRVSHIFVMLTVCFLFFLLFVFGIRSAVNNSGQMSAVMQISMFWPYLAVPVSAFFVLFECLTSIWDVLRGRPLDAVHSGEIANEALPVD
ncbi:MAG: TRAP transporter small permease [Planctomycetaceae bacterium]|nr:TRAP transporter small permease [Planctomycetaceae bacterium]